MHITCRHIVSNEHSRVQLYLVIMFLNYTTITACDLHDTRLDNSLNVVIWLFGGMRRNMADRLGRRSLMNS